MNKVRGDVYILPGEEVNHTTKQRRPSIATFSCDSVKEVFPLLPTNFPDASHSKDVDVCIEPSGYSRVSGVQGQSNFQSVLLEKDALERNLVEE